MMFPRLFRFDLVLLLRIDLAASDAADQIERKAPQENPVALERSFCAVC